MWLGCLEFFDFFGLFLGIPEASLDWPGRWQDTLGLLGHSVTFKDHWGLACAYLNLLKSNNNCRALVYKRILISLEANGPLKNFHIEALFSSENCIFPMWSLCPDLFGILRGHDFAWETFMDWGDITIIILLL